MAMPRGEWGWKGGKFCGTPCGSGAAPVRHRALRLEGAPRKNSGAGGARRCAVSAAEQALPSLNCHCFLQVSGRCPRAASQNPGRVDSVLHPSEVLRPRAQNGAVLDEGGVKKTRSLEAV